MGSYVGIYRPDKRTMEDLVLAIMECEEAAGLPKGTYLMPMILLYKKWRERHELMQLNTMSAFVGQIQRQKRFNRIKADVPKQLKNEELGRFNDVIASMFTPEQLRALNNLEEGNEEGFDKWKET